MPLNPYVPYTIVCEQKKHCYSIGLCYNAHIRQGFDSASLASAKPIFD